MRFLLLAFHEIVPKISISDAKWRPINWDTRKSVIIIHW